MGRNVVQVEHYDGVKGYVSGERLIVANLGGVPYLVDNAFDPFQGTGAIYKVLDDDGEKTEVSAMEITSKGLRRKLFKLFEEDSKKLEDSLT